MFADVTCEKLIMTDRPGPAARHRHARSHKDGQALPGAADALITELEHEFAGIAPSSSQPEAMAATRGAEARLLRGVRGIVIAEMLRRVG